MLRATARLPRWSEFHSPSTGALRKLAVVALRHYPFAADLALLARAKLGSTHSDEVPLSALDRTLWSRAHVSGRGQVHNLDLLVALAECAQELLAAEGISAVEIRQRWSEGF